MLSPLVTETDVRYKLGLREGRRRGARRSKRAKHEQRGKLYRHATRVTKLVTRQVTIYNHRPPPRTRMIMSQFCLVGSLRPKRDNRTLFHLYPRFFSIDRGESHFNRFSLILPNFCVPKLSLFLDITTLLA